MLINAFEHENSTKGNIDHLGKVPGAFSVPICRNLGGESISIVHSRKSPNYPCMCGEFGWKKGWSLWRDETPDFLVRQASCSRKTGKVGAPTTIIAKEQTASICMLDSTSSGARAIPRFGRGSSTTSKSARKLAHSLRRTIAKASDRLRKANEEG
jgi:hypothetical protein